MFVVCCLVCVLRVVCCVLVVVCCLLVAVRVRCLLLIVWCFLIGNCGLLLFGVRRLMVVV